jgi:hypothetical protein
MWKEYLKVSRTSEKARSSTTCLILCVQLNTAFAYRELDLAPAKEDQEKIQQKECKE